MDTSDSGVSKFDATNFDQFIQLLVDKIDSNSNSDSAIVVNASFRWLNYNPIFRVIINLISGLLYYLLLLMAT